jgi:hypothetical protein
LSTASSISVKVLFASSSVNIPVADT